MLTIICLKAGKLYDAAYVNRLYAMLCRHTTTPFRFICYTERNAGIHEAIETRALPPYDFLHGWWFKIWFFSNETSLTGRVVFFDLDTIIHSNIDELLNARPKFGVLQELLPRRDDPKTKKLGTAIMSWDAAWGNKLWQNFLKNPKAHMRLPGDARFLQNHLDYAQHVQYWQNLLGETYICSVKAHIFQQNRSEPPPENKIVCFHGSPRPHEVSNWPWLSAHWHSEDIKMKEPPPQEPVIIEDGIAFPGLVYRAEDIKPITYIDITKIRHKPETEEFIRNKDKAAQIAANKRANDWYTRTTINMRKNPENPFSEDSLEASIYRVYENLKRTRTMWNPLHVLEASENCYYVIQGSQRLCALHALGFRGKVPCRILYPWENLSQTRNAAIVHHPYRKVEL